MLTRVLRAGLAYLAAVIVISLGSLAGAGLAYFVYLGCDYTYRHHLNYWEVFGAVGGVMVLVGAIPASHDLDKILTGWQASRASRRDGEGR